MTESVLELMDQAEREGWGDGLPLVPIDDARLDAMLAGVDLSPADVIGVIPPTMGSATVEKIAVNAALAGCDAKLLPVLVAAVRAVTQPEFNLAAVQATTGPVAPLLVINGPDRLRLGFASGSGALGPGFRANATLGRALRLILLTLGGARPGTVDKATLGQPSKYTYCLGENEEDSPWSGLHVDRGFDPEQTTVTAFAGEGPINLNDVSANTPFAVLRIAATNMAIIGPALYFAAEPLIVLSPEHARLLADSGWSKDDISRFLYENARVPLRNLPEADVRERLVKRWPRKYSTAGEGQHVTIADRWEDITVIVAGGSGRHSTYIPPGAAARSVSVPVEHVPARR